MNPAVSEAGFRLPEKVREQLLQSRIFPDLLAEDAPRTLAVCACHAGAGATTIALNLALMLAARNGEQVSLIDANFRSRGLSGGQNDDAGFSAYAAGRIDFNEAFVSGPDGVQLMPRGRCEDPLAVMREGAQRLGDDPRPAGMRTLIDLPPLLAHPDALMLARAADGVLLVLEAEETRWPVAREARQRIEAAGLRIAGVVLNKKRHYVPGWLYRLL